MYLYIIVTIVFILYKDIQSNEFKAKNQIKLSSLDWLGQSDWYKSNKPLITAEAKFVIAQSRLPCFWIHFFFLSFWLRYFSKWKKNNNWKESDLNCYHCVKSVQIRSFFWSVFSCIRTEYGDLLYKSSYSARIHENKDQKKVRIWTPFAQCTADINMFDAHFFILPTMFYQMVIGFGS